MPPDSHYLSAAIGWLELGNCQESNAELKGIGEAFRTHPDVLEVRCKVCEMSGQWDGALEAAQSLTQLCPERVFGWVHTSLAFNALGRFQEAFCASLPVVDRFPNDWILRYNLACYACKLGNFREGWEWLEKAFQIGDRKRLKAVALADHDLEGLWQQIVALY